MRMKRLVHFAFLALGLALKFKHRCQGCSRVLFRNGN
jgi:hypothetical protein